MQLYSQQEEALKALRNFVESDISVFILKGYAGTGKTTMINIFCKELSKYNKCVKLMAPTGRAAKVLREKTGRDVTTIHKAIYRKKKFEVVWHDDEEEIKSGDEQNTKVDDMDIYFGINQISDTNEAKNTLIIVDESSLISSKICDASTGLSFIASRYSRLFILLQSVQVCRLLFKIKSSHILAALPLPSIKGWATFISTYFLTIFSIVSSGIFSMSARLSLRYIAGANANPPFAMFMPRILPAKSYSPPKI